ncbi:MAG TPA: sensor histidine kinase [Ramlibacter sp.]|nr:sensor histidine kinase [Ramlibacter sp.]
MGTDRGTSASDRSTLLDWLVRVNSQVSEWASSMSWGRLIVLFLLFLIAGSIIGNLLHLKHERVRVASTGKETVVTIGGPQGIRIVKGKRLSKGEEAPPSPGVAPGPTAQPPAAPAAPPVPPKAGDSAGATASDDANLEADDEEEALVGRQVMTLRGFLGDLGGVVMVILFAYLAAAKIVVKKVAQADAKVRTAVDAAEREAMERQLVQARLQVLQAQVEPHFLFNTLGAVDYLIETDPPRAARMQKALITYLRGALPQMRQESSTLGRELQLIRSYLELIKMRIEERLEVEIAVPEDLETAEFPPMMLQSVVENAIKHGIEPKPEGGRVSVKAGVQSGQLWVEVSDTGVGLPDGELLEGPTSGTGLGLQNLRERLAMLYPGRSRLMLRTDSATGTLVKITIPYRPATAQPAAAGGSAVSGAPA